MSVYQIDVSGPELILSPPHWKMSHHHDLIYCFLTIEYELLLMVRTLDWELEDSNFFSSLASTLFQVTNLFLVLVPKMLNKGNMTELLTWIWNPMPVYCGW